MTQRWLVPTVVVSPRVLAGCIGLGGLGGGDPEPRERSGEATITGEVTGVDVGSRLLRLTTDDRRTVTIRWDADTPVYFLGDTYSVENLEYGDRVAVRVSRDSRGDTVADWIEVEQNVRDVRGDRDDRDERAAAREVRGEVRQVDERRGELLLDTASGDVYVLWDPGVPVYWQGREYDVTDLEVGDLVVVTAREDSRRNLEASSIEVERSVSDTGGGVWDDRGDAVGAERSYYGTVDWVDDRAGAFGVRLDRGPTVRVEMPFNATTTMRSRFERLRAGQVVRFLGMPVEDERVELIRFD